MPRRRPDCAVPSGHARPDRRVHGRRDGRDAHGIPVAIHIVIGIVWLLTWGWLVARAGNALAQPRRRAALERVTGPVR